EEFYQLMLGGSASDDASLGKILGPAFSSEQIVDAVATVLSTYVDNREAPAEPFLDYVRRAGFGPFKERIYGHACRPAGPRLAADHSPARARRSAAARDRRRPLAAAARRRAVPGPRHAPGAGLVGAARERARAAGRAVGFVRGLAAGRARARGGRRGPRRAAAGRHRSAEIHRRSALLPGPAAARALPVRWRAAGIW